MFAENTRLCRMASRMVAGLNQDMTALLGKRHGIPFDRYSGPAVISLY